MSKSPWEQQWSRWETDARKLDTSPEELSRWVSLVQRTWTTHLQSLDTGRVFVEGRLPGLSSIQSGEGDFSAVLDEVWSAFKGAGLEPGSPRFFGYVPGGGLPTAALGDWLAAASNRYSGVYGASPGAAQVEDECVRWLCRVVGFPQAAYGSLLSGGATATLAALCAARASREERLGPEHVVYLTSQCHHVFTRALKICGLDHLTIQTIDVDAQWRLCVEALRRAITEDERQGRKPFIVVASAGTVNSGAVDPLGPIADLCEETSLWLHVDAAYGGFFALAEPTKPLLRDLSRASSVVMDPHKGLFLPYGCGAVLVRQGDHLRQAFASSAAYLDDILEDSHRSPADYSPELTRHFRGLRMWMSLRVHGENRLIAAISEKWALAQWLHQQLLQHSEIELGPAPQLSIVTFRLSRGGDAATEALRKRILDRGMIHVSATRLGERLFLRMCVLCFRTHREDVEIAIGEILECAKKAEEEG